MTESIDTWLQGLTRTDLIELLLELATEVEGAAAWLALQQLDDTQDAVGLRHEVDAVLTPRGGFYSYRQANDYAYDAQGIVRLLEGSADEASPDLLPVIERAIALVTRTILRADDSSGAMGDIVRGLMDAHARGARHAADALTAKERRRIADWLIRYRYGGKQDFFDPDIVAYAPALGDDGVARYRAGIAKQDLGPYGQYPLERLAVLDRDEQAIVASHGGEPANAAVAASIVESLSEARLPEAALRYARIGLGLPHTHRTQRLADLVVQHELDAGDADAALQLRRQQLARHPGAEVFGSLRATASQLGVWEEERAGAERVLRAGSAWQFLNYLLQEGRDDEAWQFALANPQAATAASRWGELCARRALTHPADTLPVYRELVTGTLEVTDKRNYGTAAKFLVAMRGASAAADQREAFERFLAETVEANRRRPTCIEAFRRAGLV